MERQKNPGTQRRRIRSAANWSAWRPSGISTKGVEILEHSQPLPRRRTPCFVAVEQQDDFFEVILTSPMHRDTYRLLLRPKVSFKGPWRACYTENPTRFLFIGSNKEKRLQLLVAEPK
jgi:hypothetical protein